MSNQISPRHFVLNGSSGVRESLDLEFCVSLFFNTGLLFCSTSVGPFFCMSQRRRSASTEDQAKSSDRRILQWFLKRQNKNLLLSGFYFALFFSHEPVAFTTAIFEKMRTGVRFPGSPFSRLFSCMQTDSAALFLSLPRACIFSF